MLLGAERPPSEVKLCCRWKMWFTGKSVKRAFVHRAAIQRAAAVAAAVRSPPSRPTYSSTNLSTWSSDLSFTSLPSSAKIPSAVTGSVTPLSRFPLCVGWHTDCCHRWLSVTLSCKSPPHFWGFNVKKSHSWSLAPPSVQIDYVQPVQEESLSKLVNGDIVDFKFDTIIDHFEVLVVILNSIKTGFFLN